jgi:hypothetical protein
MKSELEKFYELVDEIKVAMMTTRRRDGIDTRARWLTRSAPRVPDLLFVAVEGTGKLHDMEHDPHSQNTNLWTYSYTFAGPSKNISHLLL